jgi:ABC-type multidrug transport system permease subunit
MVLRVNTDKVGDATRIWLNNFILLYLVEMHKDLAMFFFIVSLVSILKFLIDSLVGSSFSHALFDTCKPSTSVVI